MRRSKKLGNPLQAWDTMTLAAARPAGESAISNVMLEISKHNSHGSAATEGAEEEAEEMAAATDFGNDDDVDIWSRNFDAADDDVGDEDEETAPQRRSAWQICLAVTLTWASTAS